MTSLEMLKKASGITANLIKERTPPVFHTCLKAYKALGELVAYAQKFMDDDVSAEFSSGIEDVSKMLDPYRTGPENMKLEDKQMSPADFMTYFQGQIDKALEEDTPASLRRLHALRLGIGKASYIDGNEIVTLPVYVDPFQQASAETVGGERSHVTSGTAQAGEVTSTPGLSLEELQTRVVDPTSFFKSLGEKVEKAILASTDIDVGWSKDLASNEFLRGERKHDFGRDGSPAK